MYEVIYGLEKLPSDIYNVVKELKSKWNIEKEPEWLFDILEKSHKKQRKINDMMLDRDLKKRKATFSKEDQEKILGMIR